MSPANEHGLIIHCRCSLDLCPRTLFLITLYWSLSCDPRFY
jgi:hypothetical protein